MPAIRQCLEHRHPYVRKNAVLAIFTIYKTFDYLIPDAPQLVENFLENENDPSCRRNAFMMLIHVDQSRALTYLKSCIDSVLSFGDTLQLVIIELVYNACVNSLSDKNLYIKCIFDLLEASSFAVKFEAANALIALITSPTAVEVAAKCYVHLILKESDNNVRLIVLDRLTSLRSNSANERILQELSLDLLTVLSAGGTDSVVDVEVSKRVLSLVIDLLTSDRVEPTINFLKKEMQRIQKRFLSAWSTNKVTTANRDVVLYHKMITKALRSCCQRFTDTLQIVVPMLIQGLSSCHSSVATEVFDLVRNTVFSHTSMKSLVYEELLQVIPTLSDPQSFRSSLWILGCSITDCEQIEKCIEVLDSSLGNFTRSDSEPEASTGDFFAQKGSDTRMAHPRVVITADGSYSTQFTYDAKCFSKCDDKNLRRIITDGSTYTASSISTVLSKLLISYRSFDKSCSKVTYNIVTAKALMVLLKVLILTMEDKKDTESSNYGIDHERIVAVLSMFTTLNDFNDEEVLDEFIAKANACVYKLLEHSPVAADSLSFKQEPKLEGCILDSQWGSLSFKSIVFNNKCAKNENILRKSLKLAVGADCPECPSGSGLLNKVLQLTGLSDPIYAEAIVTIVKFDIFLDMFVVNQTCDLLQNITLELHTLGSYKIIDKPSSIVLPSMGFGNIKAGLRISSTDCSVIFGTLMYDTVGSQGDNYSVVLNEIKLDLMDYSSTTSCTLEEFQRMWVDFEWENKVSINAKLQEFKELLDLVIRGTNMCLVSPDITLEGECDYLVTNLYVKNRFGDEALANVCADKCTDPPSINGQVRIRAKTQSIAFSLGQKFIACLKNA